MRDADSSQTAQCALPSFVSDDGPPALATVCERPNSGAFRCARCSAQSYCSLRVACAGIVRLGPPSLNPALGEGFIPTESDAREGKRPSCSEPVEGRRTDGDDVGVCAQTQWATSWLRDCQLRGMFTV